MPLMAWCCLVLACAISINFAGLDCHCAGLSALLDGSGIYSPRCASRSLTWSHMSLMWSRMQLVTHAVTFVVTHVFTHVCGHSCMWSLMRSCVQIGHSCGHAVTHVITHASWSLTRTHMCPLMQSHMCVHMACGHTCGCGLFVMHVVSLSPLMDATLTGVKRAGKLLTHA